MEKPQSRFRTAAYWTVSVLLGTMFVGAGATKLGGAQMQVENFARWGLPDWTRPIVGLVELTAALLLFVPATRFVGGFLIAAAMGGAILTHLGSGIDLQMIPMNALILAAGAWLSWTHRPAFVRRMLPQRSAG